MILKQNLSKHFYYYKWLIETRKLRKYFPKIHIESIEQTIKHIIDEKKSISRYGDGELRLLLSGCYLEFQQNSEEIRQRLCEVLQSDLANHLVALPEPICSVSAFSIASKYWWKKFINTYGQMISPFLSDEKKYANSFITRFYMAYENKKSAKIEEIVFLLKKIWGNQEILIIEGQYSRIGIGNDLFSNTKSIKRIICPSKNAFEFYNQILNLSIKYGEGKLVLLALGPTATILAYDLAKENLWAIDIGHIDIEYSWFKMGAVSKIAVPGRYVNEVSLQESLELTEECRKEYENSIIMNLTL